MSHVSQNIVGIVYEVFFNDLMGYTYEIDNNKYCYRLEPMIENNIVTTMKPW